MTTFRKWLASYLLTFAIKADVDTVKMFIEEVNKARGVGQ